jgi:hypothetical protein
LAYHFKNSFSNSDNKYYQFLEDDILLKYNDLYTVLYNERVKTKIEYFKFKEKITISKTNNDEYHIDVPNIYLTEIISFELELYEAGSNVSLNDKYLKILLNIAYEVSKRNAKGIKVHEPTDSSSINFSHFSKASTIYDLLNLGYFIIDNKIISFDQEYEFNKDSSYFSFMFALKLRQYYNYPKFIDSFLAYHFEISFLNNNDKYYHFLKDKILLGYNDIYTDLYKESVETKIKPFKLEQKITKSKTNNNYKRLNPIIKGDQIKNYFRRLTKPFGKDKTAIISEEELFKFLDANFLHFNEGDGNRSYINIEFQKPKVKTIVIRYFYEFTYKYIDSLRGEQMQQYAQAFKDSFIAFNDITIDNFIRRFPTKETEAFKRFIIETE